LSPRPGPRRHRRPRLPRGLHPLAWWAWALGLAVAASRTTNPVLLALIVAVLVLVINARRSDAPWARGFRSYLLLALVVVFIRVAFRCIFGGDIEVTGQHLLVRLPQLPLPSWAAGVQVGGPITLEGTLDALYGGLGLATLLCCIGAANTLANPKRALAVLPGALYELGVAAVVALSVAPQLIESLARVRRARRLRGDEGRRWATLRAVIVPVLEDALERSLRLAAAMDSRGYGRSAGMSRRSRRLTGALLVTGLCGCCIGLYGLLDGSDAPTLGIPALAAGAVLCAGGLAAGSRRVQRTRYRPDPWALPEWVVAASGAVPAVVLIASGASGLNPSTSPLVWPSLPLLPAAALIVAALPAVAAPPPSQPARPLPTSERPGPARPAPRTEKVPA
jgi:energy-coupling factor transport system permease protein